MNTITDQQQTIIRIPIVSADDPRCAGLARRVVFPVSDTTKDTEFFPAYVGFNIGSGADVDVSFLYSFRSGSSAGFDRHLRTEELFMPLDGDFCIPLARCRAPDDPDEQPTPEDFVGVIVRQGEGLILSPNVWHNGGWPTDPARGVRYIMILSGHRAGSGHEGRVDHIVKRFPDNATILPDWISMQSH